MTSSNIPDKTNYNKEQEDIPQNNNNYLLFSNANSSFRKYDKDTPKNTNLNSNKLIVSDFLLNPGPIVVKKFQCTCEKSKCKKKYCECFANNESCDEKCKCVECKNSNNIIGFEAPLKVRGNKTNISKHINSYQNNINDYSSINNGFISSCLTYDKNISCTCTKSSCFKNYCDCFKANQLCNKNCRCIDCKNNQEFNKRHEPKKLSIEYIRVEVREAIMIVKEGKILFVKTEAIKHSTNQLPLINETQEKDTQYNINSNNLSSIIPNKIKKMSEDISKLECSSKNSNNSNNINNNINLNILNNKKDILPENKAEDYIYLQKKRNKNAADKKN